MRISDCKSQISDCKVSGSRFLNLQSEIKNLKSPLRGGRRGVSILEVLFAILVTTVGLLGAIALLPVASAQARKGRIQDAVGVLGPSAFHRFDTEGMRRPDRWIAWNPAVAPPAYNYVSAINFPWGTSFCIDPRLISRYNLASTAPADALTASAFPYSVTSAVHPRMLRVTLDNGFAAGMTQFFADNTFTFDDDLIYNRPDDRSMQAMAIINTGWDTLPADPTMVSKRQSDGHMSWMATLVPKLDRRTSPSLVVQDQYVLSLVVFYDRPADMPISGPSERIVNVAPLSAATMPSLGVTGGEILLSAATPEELNVRTNDWIMLMGKATHADVNPAAGAQPGTVNVFKWYRVTSTEAEATDDDGNGVYERYVTLFGQDWDVSNLTDQYAVVVDGVVGVYEKTIRLEQ